MTSTKFHQPWINTKTKRLIRKKNRWFQKAKKTNSAKVWKIYKKIKSECQKSIRSEHQKLINDMFSEDKSNKKLWSYFKSKSQENVGVGEIKNHNNIPTRDPKTKAKIIHEQFDSVFSDPNPKIKHQFDSSKR